MAREAGNPSVLRVRSLKVLERIEVFRREGAVFDGRNDEQISHGSKGDKRAP